MKSLINTITWVQENWSSIVIIIGLVLAVAQKVKSYSKLSKEEKEKLAETQKQELIQLAKDKLKETIINYVTEAELEWEDYVSAGAIKRAEVIKKIYADYPILGSIVDQDKLISEIDELIDSALAELKKVLDANKPKTEVITETVETE